MRNYLLLILLAAALVFGISSQPAKSVPDPVIVAAGDICLSTGGSDCAPTANLIESINPDAVLTLGDNAYEDGTLAEFNSKYAPNWGRATIFPKTYPSPGNHEFHTTGAQGYRDYFGARAPDYAYSYNIGNWHLVSLPGLNVTGTAPSIAAQATFLSNDLAAPANVGKCSIVYWHEPRFSSGTTHGSSGSAGPLYTAADNGNATLVLNGHEHNYERFAPQDNSANPVANAPREFVVGTGGAGFSYPFGTPIANSQVRGGPFQFGVLKLTLHPTSYDFQFVPAAGSTFTDSGTGVPCPGVTQSGPFPRYMFRSAGGEATSAANGFNLMDVSSAAEADALPAGTQGLVWIGDYNNTTCNWDQSDSAITATVNAAANDAKVAGFFLSDEPDPAACPSVYSQHQSRNSLVKGLAPTKYTFVALDANSGAASLNQIPNWTPAMADHFGLDPYPCRVGQPCDTALIPATISAANAAGMNYWGVAQAFNDSNWRWPTSAELTTMLCQWGASNETGFATFAWSWNGNLLSSQPGLLNVLNQFNAGTLSCGAPPPATTVERQPAVSNDDAEEQSTGSMYNSSSDLEMMFDGTLQRAVGVRFPNMTIPVGATVSTAWVQFTAKEAQSEATSLTIKAEAADNSAIFGTTANNITNRATTTASATWAPTAWTAEAVGAAQKTPELKTLIQAVVNRAGWASGNALSLIVTGTGHRTAYALDGSAVKSALLHVEYTTGSPPPPPPDTTPPSVPTGLTITNPTKTSLTLSWTASTDNIGVTGYEVSRNNVVIANPTGTSINETGLVCANAPYSYTVRARDAAGNFSAASAAKVTDCTFTP